MKDLTNAPPTKLVVNLLKFGVMLKMLVLTFAATGLKFLAPLQINALMSPPLPENGDMTLKPMTVAMKVDAVILALVRPGCPPSLDAASPTLLTAVTLVQFGVKPLKPALMMKLAVLQVEWYGVMIKLAMNTNLTAAQMRLNHGVTSYKNAPTLKTAALVTSHGAMLLDLAPLMLTAAHHQAKSGVTSQ